MQNPWQSLFAHPADSNPATTRAFRVIKRGGNPFLFLPQSSAAARRALELFPAQSTKARAARSLLKIGLRAGFAPGSIRADVRISRHDSFARFLSKIAGGNPDEPPQFAVLAGNPNAPGRRFVFLLFDDADNPVAVVKAGYGQEARVLIAHEAAMLGTARTSSAGIPKLRDVFSSPQVEAFATDFISGESPTGCSTGVLGELFTSWLNPGGPVPLRKLDAWQRLIASEGKDALPSIILALGDIEISPTLAHGDFAPWNVKVEDSRWTVLDWERGDAAGIPGWDWLHFIIQPAVLVAKESADKTLARLEDVFGSPEFISYAKKSGIATHEKVLTLAYLFYCVRVTKQTEGLEGLQNLTRLVEEKWTGGLSVPSSAARQSAS